jgi:plasminogen activator inhibitor 1 RNA-binding protein
MALDLSDDENITVAKAAPAPASKPEKKQPSRVTGDAAKTHQPRKELEKEAENLQQKKKHPGYRGAQPQPDNVAHPGERSKIGLKKEEHVNTHKQAEGEPRRGRQFERHSGTGRGKEIKKGGGGGHNWGKAGEEVPAPAATPDAENAAAEEAPVVEEDPSLTLEEYEKLRAQKRSGEAFQAKEARKVTTQVTGTVYKKDEETGEGDYIKLGGNDEPDAKKKPAHVKKEQKKVFEIDFKVRDSSAEAPRPRRPEGSRGPSRSSPREEGAASRPHGGGAPRGPRTGAPRTGAPAAAGGRIDTADVSAFPKLGGSA